MDNVVTGESTLPEFKRKFSLISCWKVSSLLWRAGDFKRQHNELSYCRDLVERKECSVLNSADFEIWKVVLWVHGWSLGTEKRGMAKNGRKDEERGEKNLMINDAEPVSWFFFSVHISCLWSPHAFFLGSYTHILSGRRTIKRKSSLSYGLWIQSRSGLTPYHESMPFMI